MRASIVTGVGGPEVVQPGELPDPTAGPGEVLVALETAALNHRDVWIRTGRGDRPAVLGSDGAGRIAAVGDGVAGPQVGTEVVINPYLNWGGREDGPEPGGEILGVPHQGTHAELIAVPADHVLPRPARLSWEEAAALPLAGLTAWRALVTRGRVAQGMRVLIPGAGGGVSTFLVQLAHAMGAEVVVTSAAAWKLDRGRELGATLGVLYTDPEWPAQVGEIDLAIDSIGAASWPGIFECLRIGGTLVSFGRTGGSTAEIDVPRFYYGQWNLLGTTMGSPRELDALLAHVERADWRPVVDSSFPLAEAAAAHARLEHPDRFGKVVLRVR
ncbi:MAG: zinc-binding dehydrogenase [Gaiellales bacterium]|jgi:zinc-binding alcohol dehydrogenase/oxidoreductase